MSKVLCLSDLHLQPGEMGMLDSFGVIPPMLGRAIGLVERLSPDAVVLTGDTLQGSQISLLPKTVETLTRGKIPCFVTLGNHELWGHSLEEARELLAEAAEELKAGDSGVCFLDLERSVEWDGKLVTGCVLLFDGSMRVFPDQKVTDWNGWRDHLIMGIEDNYARWCGSMREKLKREISERGSGRSVLLCTHTLPDERLNGHEPSVYSFYSGVKDLTGDLPLDQGKEHWAICGHTHRRVIRDLRPGVHGVNAGSD